MSASLLLGTVGLSALCHIGCEFRSLRRAVYLFKPLTVLLIIALAIFPPHPASRTQYVLLLAGLIFSLLGDVFLMLPDDRFIPGLVSFLIAHICYIAAFSWRMGWHYHQLWVLIPFLAFGAAMLAYLWPHLGTLRVPVVVYLTAILVMAWRGAARYSVLPAGPYWLGLLGVCLFLVSDSLLAVNRFVKPFYLAPAAIMGTYYTAQTLIVLSFRGG